MRKLAGVFLLLSVFGIQLSTAAPKRGKAGMTESQKMKKEIDRIEKRVNEINNNIEAYKENEKKLDELEVKYEETVTDLRLK